MKAEDFLDDKGSAEDFLDAPAAAATPPTPKMPQAPPTLRREISNLKNMAITKGKELIEPYKRIGEPFASGVYQGAALGAVRPSDKESQYDDLSGSVVDPYKLERTALGAGKFVGSAIPIAAASMTGGALGAAAGASKAAGQAAGGLLYGAAEGAAQGKPIAETVPNMAMQGALFAGFSKAEDAAKYIKDVFKNSATVLANWFANVNPEIAQDLLKKGKPDVGRQMLDIGEGFRGMKSRKEIYNRAKLESYRLNNSVDQQLQNIEDSVLAPNPNTATVKGTPQLEYKPTQVIQPKGETPLTHPPYQYPQSEPLQSESLRHMVPIPEQAPSVVYLPKPLETPPKTYPTATTAVPGGNQYDPYGGVRQTPSPGSGIMPQAEGGSYTPNLNQTTLKRSQIEMFKKTNALRQAPFSISKDLGVDIAPIKDTPVITKLMREIKSTKGVGAEEYRALSLLQNRAAITAREANSIRKILDDSAGRDYLKDDVTYRTDAVMDAANYLRKALQEKHPEIAADLAKEHLMLQIEQSLRPVVAGTKMPYGGSFSLPVRGAVGSRASLGLATGLDVLSKTPESAIKSASFAGKAAASNKAKTLKEKLMEYTQ